MPEDYLILTAATPLTLERKVLQHLQNGYQLVGQPFTWQVIRVDCHANGTPQDTRFGQAVIKYDRL